jgi:hypothetical protein
LVGEKGGIRRTKKGKKKKYGGAEAATIADCSSPIKTGKGDDACW